MQVGVPFAEIAPTYGVPPLHGGGVAAKAVAVAAFPFPARNVLDVVPNGHSKIELGAATLKTQARNPESADGEVPFRFGSLMTVPFMLIELELPPEESVSV
jgi:hypothetical protein